MQIKESLTLNRITVMSGRRRGNRDRASIITTTTTAASASGKRGHTEADQNHGHRAHALLLFLWLSGLGDRLAHRDVGRCRDDGKGQG